MQRREFLKSLLVIAFGTSTAKLLGFADKKVADEPIAFEGKYKDWIFLAGRVNATEGDYTYTTWFWCRGVVERFDVKKQVAFLSSEIKGIRGVDRILSRKECKAIFELEKKSYG